MPNGNNYIIIYSFNRSHLDAIMRRNGRKNCKKTLSASGKKRRSVETREKKISDNELRLPHRV